MLSILTFLQNVGFLFAALETTVFTKNSNLNGKYSTDKLITSEATSSVIDCVRQCSRNTACKSIFFRTPTYMCLLNSINYDSAGVLEVGVLYYEQGYIELQSSPVATFPAATNISFESTQQTTTSKQLTTTTNPPTATTSIPCTGATCINGNCQSATSCVCYSNYAGNMCQKAYTHSGCYQITMSEVTVDPTSLSILICVNTCITVGKPYAGIMNGNRCFCGNSISSGIQAGGCNSLCTGGGGGNCGGTTDKSVFHITP